jgi:hypothetical protein
MACPKCDHTMQNIGCNHAPYHDVPVFWCPRCGTLKASIVTQQDEVPKLVSRVVEFCSQLGDDDDTVIHMIKQMGIHESVTLPGQR